MRQHPHAFRGGRNSGFTLMEILIVAALIALFAGMFLAGYQTIREQTIIKVMYDEARQLATASDAAHFDIGYYPRFTFLSKPSSLLEFEGEDGARFLYPGFDYYGHMERDDPKTFKVFDQWEAPYISSFAGVTAREYLVVRVRLPDQDLLDFADEVENDEDRYPTLQGDDPSVVLWPSDHWGNPWVFYQVTADPQSATDGNPLGLRLIRNPSESANYFNAIVSYGPNGVPGGNDQTRIRFQDFYQDQRDMALYVEDDLVGDTAQFTMKTFNAPLAEALLPESEDGEAAFANFNRRLAESLHNQTFAYEGEQGRDATAGVMDPGSDDIIYTF